MLEALTEHGLIRRGNAIWQYGTVRFTEHGGAVYGGVEHDGGAHDRLVRLVQRLDGFVAVTPASGGKGSGTLVTKPLVFAGERLELNVDAAGGFVRVELREADGRPIRGFTLAHSEPLRANSPAAVVRWRTGGSLAKLAGRPVQLAIEVTDARLFALQFQ